MPLSEREQRLLDEMERQLLAEDPRLAATADLDVEQPVVRRSKRRIGFGVAVAVAGMALLVFAVSVQLIWLGVIAFLVMFGGAAWALFAPGTSGPSSGPGGGGGGRPSAGSGPDGGGFMSKVEERWERRQTPDA
jgi:hypothetical protein